MKQTISRLCSRNYLSHQGSLFCCFDIPTLISFGQLSFTNTVHVASVWVASRIRKN